VPKHLKTKEALLVLFSFRVALPDRPGALAQLTALIASHSIDVRAVDVLGGRMTEAVDQFLLEGDYQHAEALAAELRNGGAFTLLSNRRAGVTREMLPELTVVQAVAKQPDRALTILTHAAPRLLDADWAVCFEAGLSYCGLRTPSAPEVQWAGRVPLRSSRVTTSGMFTLPDGLRPTLAMAPIPDIGVVLIGRDDETPFHGTEILRLQQLMTTIEALITATHRVGTSIS
jgi:hypothetical protein